MSPTKKYKIRRRIPKLFNWSAAEINFTYWTMVKLFIIKLLIDTLSTNCIMPRKKFKIVRTQDVWIS